MELLVLLFHLLDNMDCLNRVLLTIKMLVSVHHFWIPQSRTTLSTYIVTHEHNHFHHHVRLILTIIPLFKSQSLKASVLSADCWQHFQIKPYQVFFWRAWTARHLSYHSPTLQMHSWALRTVLPTLFWHQFYSSLSQSHMIPHWWSFLSHNLPPVRHLSLRIVSSLCLHILTWICSNLNRKSLSADSYLNLFKFESKVSVCIFLLEFVQIWIETNLHSHSSFILASLSTS